MKYLKTYENWSISLAPKGMDQGFYFFLKKKFEGTKFEITYNVGFDDKNVDDVYFVQDDGIDDNDKYVSINDKMSPKKLPDGSTNTITDYYASEFNVITVQDDLNLNVTETDYVELHNLLKSCVEEYKNTDEYDKYMMGIESNKYNL